MQSHSNDLNTSHATLNKNVKMLMELLKEIMSMQQLSVARNSSFPQANSSPLHTPSLYYTHTTPLKDPIKETIELIKNLKPPIFSGEDKKIMKGNFRHIL